MENYISRIEYENRQREVLQRLDHTEKGIAEIKEQLDKIEIGTWKLIANSTIGFLIGSGAIGLIEWMINKR